MNLKQLKDNSATLNDLLSLRDGYQNRYPSSKTEAKVKQMILNELSTYLHLKVEKDSSIVQYGYDSAWSEDFDTIKINDKVSVEVDGPTSYEKLYKEYYVIEIVTKYSKYNKTRKRIPIKSVKDIYAVGDMLEEQFLSTGDWSLYDAETKELIKSNIDITYDEYLDEDDIFKRLEQDTNYLEDFNKNELEIIFDYPYINVNIIFKDHTEGLCYYYCEKE